jgi:cathepsin D
MTLSSILAHRALCCSVLHTISHSDFVFIYYDRDLWLASGNCGAQCNGIATFDVSQSSSFTNQSKSFEIQYGSGAAAGYLGQDVVRMSGFEVSNQVFGVVNQLSKGLLDAPVSGLMGLAWQTISSSGAMPLWQTLASTNGTWDEPLMAFQLTR